MQLKGGQLVFVQHEKRFKHKLRETVETTVIYGFNLESPYLRTKSFRAEAFDHHFQWQKQMDLKKDEILAKGMKPNSYYVLDKKNKYHSAKVTQNRLEMISNTLLKLREANLGSVLVPASIV